MQKTYDIDIQAALFYKEINGQVSKVHGVGKKFMASYQYGLKMYLYTWPLNELIFSCHANIMLVFSVFY